MRRVFLSSTFRDLEEHRSKVLDSLHGTGEGAVAMEYFHAEPNAPLPRCLELARGADALVLVLAFCDGWVPAVEQGGDGQASITSLELRAAEDAGVPVFAFLADDSARVTWRWGRDTDRFYDIADDEVPAALSKVRRLRALRDEVGLRYLVPIRECKIVG